MRTSVKVILGIYGAFVGVWLAGSAYFWLKGHATYAEPELPPSEPLSTDENAYPLFQQLRLLWPTNGSLTVVYDYLHGQTNGVEVAAEVDAIIASQSNVFACVRQILKCRGVQVAEGEDTMDGSSCLFANASIQLYRIKVMREAERGEIASARKTLDEQFAYARFLSEHGWLVSYLYGQSAAGCAQAAGLRTMVVAGDDTWLEHLAEVVGEWEEALEARFVRATWKDLEIIRGRTKDATNNANRRGLVLDGGLMMLVRFTLGDDGHLMRCIDWNRFWRQYATHFLSLFAGYAGYSFNPQLTFVGCVGQTQELVAKLQTPKFDRDYARREDTPQSASVLTENWLGKELNGNWTYSMYNRHYQALFDWRATLLRIACLRYKLKHGQYPAALSELVPAYMAAIPSDPYEDEPIRYNAEYAYFWTPGPKGDFDGKVSFGKDGSPRLGTSGRYVRFIEPERAGNSW